MWFDFLFSDIAMLLATIVLFGLVVVCAETERLFGGLGLLIAGAAAFDYGHGFPIMHWVASYPVQLAGYGLLYLAFGAFYTAFWEWRNYCKANADPSELKSFLTLYTDKTSADYYANPRHFDLHPSNHYYMLTNWMLLWPFALFWTLLHDPITWIAKTMYSFMGNIFLKIAVLASQQSPK